MTGPMVFRRMDVNIFGARLENDLAQDESAAECYLEEGEPKAT